MILPKLSGKKNNFKFFVFMHNKQDKFDFSSVNLDFDVVCLASLGNFIALEKTDGTIWKIENGN